MKQECPTHLKSIGKSKALATTLSDSEPETDSNESDQEGIVSAFTAIVKSTEGEVKVVDEEEEMMESNFEKMDDQNDIHIAYAKLYKVFEKHKKLYKLTIRKLNEVELEREELFTKFDEANQTIGALRFENNLLVEYAIKLDTKLFQVRAQLKRTLSAKLDEILNVQKTTSDRTSIKYDHSISSCSTSSNALNRVIFVPLANNDNSENNEVTDIKTENVSEDRSDEGKSILGAPPKVGKKEPKHKNHRSTNKKSPLKKPHFCHYYGASGHTCPSCYKWLSTQQRNSV